MKTLIRKLRGGLDLNGGDISIAVAAILSEATDDALKAEFLTALHRKGETVDEILGFVQQLVDRAIDRSEKPIGTDDRRLRDGR